MAKRVDRMGLGFYLAGLLAVSFTAGSDCAGCSQSPSGAGSAVDAGPDQTVNVGDTVRLMGTSTGVATHKWELMSRPTGSSAVILNERSLTNAAFIADEEGEYVAKLIGAVSNNPTAPDVNPAATDTVTITAVAPANDGGVGGAGGSGGAGGGVDPCAIELPDPAGDSGLKVDVYAVLEIMPAGISFAQDGTLFMGTNTPEQTSPVFWVSPDGSTLDESPEDFEDPDALIVDIAGLVASTPGNVLIGGSFDGGNTGQLVEMTPEGNSVGDPFLDPCLRNINHLFFDVSDRLIATNYNLVQANVCAVLQDRNVIDLIPDVAGDGPAGLTAQDPNTEDLFVSVEGTVHLYDSNGAIKQEDYITGGSAMSYGPKDSPFEGLLIRRSGQLLVRRDPASTTEELLLTGRVGSFHAFHPDGQDANLYISDPPSLRVLRVSLESKNLEPTKKPVGCADP